MVRGSARLSPIDGLRGLERWQSEHMFGTVSAVATPGWLRHSIEPALGLGHVGMGGLELGMRLRKKDVEMAAGGGHPRAPDQPFRYQAHGETVPCVDHPRDLVDTIRRGWMASQGQFALRL